MAPRVAPGPAEPSLGPESALLAQKKDIKRKCKQIAAAAFACAGLELLPVRVHSHSTKRHQSSSVDAVILQDKQLRQTGRSTDRNTSRIGVSNERKNFRANSHLPGNAHVGKGTRTDAGGALRPMSCSMRQLTRSYQRKGWNRIEHER